MDKPTPHSGANEKTNLLLVASGLWIGGAEMVIAHLARTLDRSRFNVTICHLKSRGHIGDELVREGFEVVAIEDANKEKVDYFSFRKLLRLIRERRIDVVHTHTTQGLVDASICRMLTPRLKLVHTFHFGNYPHTRLGIRIMERIFSHGADLLFAVGQVQRRQLQALYGFSDRRIGMLWNGVTAPVKDAATGFPAKVQANGRVIVGTIATFIDQKGLPDLLDVARRVRDAGHDAVFVIVGDGPMRAELEAKRRDLGLEQTVVFTGWVTHAADAALPAFDIFFQPSLWEAMSVVLLESMSAGKAIVATRVGEAPTFLIDGTDALLVESRDVAGMAAALGSLIADANRRKALGDAARVKWEQNFTVTHMTRAYENVYRNVGTG